jgi:hypothetical protein
MHVQPPSAPPTATPPSYHPKMTRGLETRQTVSSLGKLLPLPPTGRNMYEWAQTGTTLEPTLADDRTLEPGGTTALYRNL